MESKSPEKQVGIRDAQGRFVKGSTGNAGGRPKRGESWSEIIAIVLEEQHGQSRQTIREAIVRRAAEMAVDGDYRARAWLADRESGTPRQSVFLTPRALDQVVVIG